MGNERQSGREQVLEWLMAERVNSRGCSFLIKGMNFSFVSPVNNEHPAALKHHPSGALHRQQNISWLLQISFSLPSGNLEPLTVT